MGGLAERQTAQVRDAARSELAGHVADGLERELNLSVSGQAAGLVRGTRERQLGLVLAQEASEDGARAGLRGEGNGARFATRGRRRLERGPGHGAVAASRE